jgi:WD40 repeat protein
VIVAVATVQGFSHHRDIVTGLAFRDDTHVLYSGSFDRTVKIWSLDDRAYVDTLYGHQSEVHRNTSRIRSRAAVQDGACEIPSQSGVCLTAVMARKDLCPSGCRGD